MTWQLAIPIAILALSVMGVAWVWVLFLDQERNGP